MSKRLYGVHGGLRCDRQEDKQHKTLTELKAIHGTRCPVCAGPPAGNMAHDPGRGGRRGE